MMIQPKQGVVNLNLQLTPKITQFECIEKPDIFRLVSCNLNFTEDQVEFMLDICNDDLNKIKIQKTKVHFQFSKNDPVSLPITLNDQKIENSVCKINIHANFKDCFLHLFKADQKEFLLTICYTGDVSSQSPSKFSALLPDLPIATSSSRKFLEHYNVESLFRGIELKKLFEKNFASYSGITYEEQELLMSLKSCQTATINDRFSYKYNFLTMFQYMVAIEDMESIKEIRKYALNSAQFYRYIQCPTYLKIKIEQQLRSKINKIEYANNIFVIKAENKLDGDLMKFDSVYIYSQSDYKKYQNDCKKLFDIRMDAKIEHLFDDIIIVTILPGFEQPSSIKNDNSYCIEFVPNRIPVRIVQRALADMKSMDMKSKLQNFEINDLYRCSKEKFEKLDWFSSSITTNEEQMLAVKNIVNCTSFPSPFIIFGGPGTGKSTTIVEAIAQIVKMKPDSHVLFTAGSNSTCDDIGNRLAKYVSVNKILRIHAAAFDQKKDKIHQFIGDSSNFRSLGNSNLSYNEFLTARVVIVTIISAGQIVNKGYPSNHFNYIFIDEAGFVSEPECYVPLSGLGLLSGRFHAQLVLAGDHKQLRPTITNPFAERMGLEVSLMERLMDNDKKYKRSENGYDHNFVVQLKQNYRNHPAIMRFSNENFYDSQLVSMQTDRMEHPLITNKEFPIIFHGNTSPSEMVGTSLKNEGELTILKTYITNLLNNGTGENRVMQSDIGIISPYSAQRNKMINMFGKKYPKVEIGTVDSFQGREKKIILISCVRSGTSHIGFLSNEKRLNVALTRAKSLLIVIGNAATLQKSNIWHKFIMYCYKNKAAIGNLKGVDLKGLEDC